MKNRILERRKKLVISLATLSKRTGISEQHLNRLEKGERRLNEDNLNSIAGALRCSPAELLTGKRERLVPVLGYIGTGEQVILEDQLRDGSLEEVDAPPGYDADEVSCIVVRGSNMEPVLEDRWLVFYGKDPIGVSQECIGRLCIVKLDDSILLAKKVHHGSSEGLFHLVSKNPIYDTLFDRKLIWATPVVFIVPR